MFYQLYVGVRPFDGANHEVLDMQLHKKMPLKLIPRKDVRAIIAKATNKRQELRYHSAAEFRVDMDRLETGAVAVGNPMFVRRIAIWAGGIVAVAVLSVVVWNLLPEDSDVYLESNQIQEASSRSYQSAVIKLRSAKTAEEGLNELNQLSDEGDYNATYLLSRLKFDGKTRKEYDNIPDSIWPMQLTLKIKADSREAHRLLEKSVSLNSNDYNSLYALGMDYLVGDRVSLDPNTRNLRKSKECLDKALKLASQDGNQQVISKIQELYKEYAIEFAKVEKEY